MVEIYLLIWTGDGAVHEHGCHDNRERADRHCKIANMGLKWRWRIFGDRWGVRTFKLQQGPLKKKGG